MPMLYRSFSPLPSPSLPIPVASTVQTGQFPYASPKSSPLYRQSLRPSPPFTNPPLTRKEAKEIKTGIRAPHPRSTIRSEKKLSFSIRLSRFPASWSITKGKRLVGNSCVGKCGFLFALFMRKERREEERKWRYLYGYGWILDSMFWYSTKLGIDTVLLVRYLVGVRYQAAEQ